MHKYTCLQIMPEYRQTVFVRVHIAHASVSARMGAVCLEQRQKVCVCISESKCVCLCG